MNIKKVIFTVSKNSDLRHWESYHLDKLFEIYVIDNGNLIYNVNKNFHILVPNYSQDILGHATQQEYLMNMFYKNYSDNALIYFIDDDEYIVENEPLKGNTYLNWKIYNGKYYPNTSLNMYFKPVVKTNQNIHITLHNIVFLNDNQTNISKLNQNQTLTNNTQKAISKDNNERAITTNETLENISNEVRDGNNELIDADNQFLECKPYKNYIIHHQYTSLKDFNNKLSIRPSYEKSKYLKIRIKGFYECMNIKDFHMCIILDNYDKLDILRKLYHKITFFIITPVIPNGADIEIVPNEYIKCPEQYIFKYAEYNVLDIVIKRASKINTNIIDIEDEYKNVDINKTIKHYQELQLFNHLLIDNIKTYKEYGLFNYIDIVKMNQIMNNLKVLSFESKSYKIIFEALSLL